MDPDKPIAAEIQSDEEFKRFIDQLGMICKDNKSSLHSLQKELQNLIESGKDVIQKIENQTRFVRSKSYIYIYYFMVGERVRFLITSCEESQTNE